MAEPDFISQNGDLETDGQKMSWFRERDREAEAKGAVWRRYSWHPTIPNLILYEGWKVKPVDADGNLDEGEPRWQMTAAA